MSSQQPYPVTRALIERIRRLALELPAALVESIARAVREGGGSQEDWPSVRARVLQTLSHPGYRALACELLDLWNPAREEIGAEALALALSTAAHIARSHREEQTIEVVWTGPNTDAIAIRHTEQVLLQLIESARERLLVVSYAVFRIQRVCQALVKAADRGVSLRIVVESPDTTEGAAAYDNLRAFGSRVAERASVYIWPAAQRATDKNGKPGILHVKCAVADGRVLLISSANLTKHAFTLNMELGLLITGGPVPRQVETHFSRLISAGVLVVAS